MLFALMAFLVTGTIVTNYCTSYIASHLSSRTMQTHNLIDELRASDSILKDAETGQRGYLLTGDAKYLAPYWDALAAIQKNFAALQAHVDQGRVKPGDLSTLQKLTQAKLDELAKTIGSMQKNQPEAALAIVRTDAGLSAMNGIRSHVDNMILALNADLVAEQRTAARMEWLRMIVVIATTGLNLAFLGWAFGRLKRETTAREASNHEVQRQKDLLAVTLASIGDAVIVTDMDGQITFMNRIAEELTGWPMADAAGKTLSQVFKIVNEQTARPWRARWRRCCGSARSSGWRTRPSCFDATARKSPSTTAARRSATRMGRLRGVVLVFRDFSDHQESERRLRQANAEVEAASRAKDHFLATLSHELRTPLTPILATLDSWEAGSEVPAALRDDVRIIRRNIALEARLIDDLLDLTRIVRGKLALNLDQIDVHEMVEAVAGMCRADAEVKRIELSLRLQARRHHANADAARLQQVFWNVLKNAIKFTPEGRHIEVATTNAPATSLPNRPAVSPSAINSPDPVAGPDTAIRVTFTDDGIGMTEETLARVFRPFEQATEETARRYGGLGLGLAISRGSSRPWAAPFPPRALARAMARAFQCCYRLLKRPQCRRRRRRGEAPAASAPADTRALSILLVEDHADTALVMSRLLRRLGHTVHTSSTVAEAAEQARKTHYDLLLSDIGLPDGTGIDLLRQVQAHRDLTAIALTGYGMEDDIARCLEAGFSAHLTKPIDFQHLERMVQQVADGQANGKGKA